jgi:hypothetical protein
VSNEVEGETRSQGWLLQGETRWTGNICELVFLYNIYREGRRLRNEIGDPASSFIERYRQDRFRRRNFKIEG